MSAVIGLILPVTGTQATEKRPSLFPSDTRPGTSKQKQVYIPAKQYSARAIELGKKLYRQGILESGASVSGFVSGDVPVQGSHLACVSCHKRSGFGAIEGNITTPQITADVLFLPVTSRASEIIRIRNANQKTRTAYNERTLARVIRLGLNSDGRQLNPLMPKYTLSEADMNNLIAYLSSLRSSSSKGVTDTDIYIATVISKNIDPKRRRAMLRVLYKFIADWNTDTRPKTKRAAYAPWHKKWHYESHRTWKIKPWVLEGPEDSWFTQLQLLNARRPVFAVIGGVVDGRWEPVNKFCEQYEVPCLFPNTNLPTIEKNSYYSVFFSKGLRLEAEVLAKYIRTGKKLSTSKRIVQIHSNSASGNVPAELLRRKLVSASYTNVIDIPLADGSDWLDGLNVNEADVVVLWLNNQEILKLPAGFLKKSKADIYLSAGLHHSDKDIKDSRTIIGQDLSVVYPYTKPERYNRLIRSTKNWLKAKKLSVVDERLQANTFYTATLISRAIRHIGSNFSGDYLIERLEHLDRSLAISPIYPSLTLGTGQRFASKGAYIAEAKLDNNNEVLIEITSPWIVP